MRCPKENGDVRVLVSVILTAVVILVMLLEGTHWHSVRCKVSFTLILASKLFSLGKFGRKKWRK
jgi:hypothetical protein